MWLQGLDFQEACELLAQGEPPTRPDQTAARPAPRRRRRRRLTPPNPTWQERARTFIEFSQKLLWLPEGRPGLEYLKSRSLTETTIQAAGLGYNPHDIHDLPQRWGLDDRDTIWLPGPGIVIPWLAGGQVWRINIRLVAPRLWRSGSGREKLIRYRGPAGFSNGLYNADTLSLDRPAVLVEGELDALTITQQAGDLVAAVATGSTSGSRRRRWMAQLAKCPLVLVAFDAEEAGDKAAEFWLKNLPNAWRWRPCSKDVNAMATEGMDLRHWLEEALPPPARPRLAPTWPITITWPADTPVAAVGNRWERLPDGSVQATYHDIDELRWCIELMQIAREVEEVRSREQVQF
jgi:hypothetical protein